MFHLKERTRRRVAMAAFALFGVLPTLLVLVCGLMRSLPGAVGRESAGLSRSLGLPVALEGVDHPWPGIVVYRGLRLADPATERTVLECGRLEARWQRSAASHGGSHDELVLVASQTRLDAAAIDSIRGLLETWLRTVRSSAFRSGRGTARGLSQFSRSENGTVPFGTRVRATTAELTLQYPDGPWTLKDVRAVLCSDSGQTALNVDFTLAEVQPGDCPDFRAAKMGLSPSAAKKPGKFRLRLAPSGPALPAEVAIDTGECSVPCGVLALVMPGFLDQEDLGPKCRFRGHVEAHQTPEGWDGRLAGQFRDLDLEQLVAERFGHRLTGTAELTIDEATLRAGRLVDAAGQLSAGPGAIGRTLVESAALSLGLTPGPGFFVKSTAEDPVPFERLALRFSLTAAGLRLKGECPSAGDGVAAVGRHGPILSIPPDQMSPPKAIARALALPGDVQFPATLRTAWLAERLPTPEGSREGLGIRD